MQRLRIKGLVRAMNSVRDRLAHGILEAEAEGFRRHVRGITRTIEEMCARQGASPSDLPAQSRNAYAFLKGLDLDRLPVRRAGEEIGEGRIDARSGVPRPGRVRIKNVVRVVDSFQEEFARDARKLAADPEELGKFRKVMTRQVSDIEKILRSRDVTPADLPVPSMDGYAWMKFLLRADNLEAHMAALSHALEVAETLPWPPDRPLTLRLRNLRALYRIRRFRDRIHIDCSEGYLRAPDEVWRALFRRALGDRSTAVRRQIEEYSDTEEYSDVIFELSATCEAGKAGAKGRVHDLEEAFRRVNESMFDGRMARPALQWNRAPTVHKFGHYDSSRDTVMVSQSLDDEEVPPFVLDFLVYHELLHKKHGLTWTSDRRMAHTPAFRADERRFPDYTAAKTRISKIARKQRGRG